MYEFDSDRIVVRIAETIVFKSLQYARFANSWIFRANSCGPRAHTQAFTMSNFVRPHFQRHISGKVGIGGSYPKA